MRRGYPNKAALCACALPAIVLTVTWWLTGWRYLQRLDSAPQPRWCVALLRGAVEVHWGAVVRPPLSLPETPGYSSGRLDPTVHDTRWSFTPAVRTHLNGQEAVLPLWVPMLVVLGLALVPWTRPHQRGCPACGYSRRGIGVWADCPECGERSPARDARAWW